MKLSFIATLITLVALSSIETVSAMNEIREPLLPPNGAVFPDQGVRNSYAGQQLPSSVNPGYNVERAATSSHGTISEPPPIRGRLGRCQRISTDAERGSRTNDLELIAKTYLEARDRRLVAGNNLIIKSRPLALGASFGLALCTGGVGIISLIIFDPFIQDTQFAKLSLEQAVEILEPVLKRKVGEDEFNLLVKISRIFRRHKRAVALEEWLARQRDRLNMQVGEASIAETGDVAGSVAPGSNFEFRSNNQPYVSGGFRRYDSDAMMPLGDLRQNSPYEPGVRGNSRVNGY